MKEEAMFVARTAVIMTTGYVARLVLIIQTDNVACLAGMVSEMGSVKKTKEKL